MPRSVSETIDELPDYREVYLAYSLGMVYGVISERWAVYKLNGMGYTHTYAPDPQTGRRKARREVTKPPELVFYAEYDSAERFLSAFPLEESSFSRPEHFSLFMKGSYPFRGPFVLVKQFNKDGETYIRRERDRNYTLKVVEASWDI